jgi:hypothetical protein
VRRRWTVQAVFLGVILLLAGVVGVQLAAALPDEPTASPSPTPVDWATVRPGADASWPACTPPHGTKRTLPLASRPAFVVIGVNDGLPGTVSACIDRELQWADTTTGGSSQPRLAYYAMAADPWTKAQLKWVKHPAWPSGNTVGGVRVRVPAAFASSASGTTCTGGHREHACAYVYGWAMAQHAAGIAGLRDPAHSRFWIDVEAERTWGDDQRFNQAVVEGMVAAGSVKAASARRPGSTPTTPSGPGSSGGCARAARSTGSTSGWRSARRRRRRRSTRCCTSGR